MANEPSKTVRATVSLSKVVSEMAEQLMRKKGYDNFSAYVADLIRRDRERDEERELAMRPRQAKADQSPTQTKRKAAS